MTPTATKSKTASAELEALQKVRDRHHAKVLEAKVAIRAWDDETEAMRARLTAHINLHPDQVSGPEKRIKPGSEAQKLSDEIQQRFAITNPHQAAYDKAFPAYEAADLAVQGFKVARVHDRLAELEPDAERAVDRLREGFKLIAEACEDYGGVVQGVRSIVVDTPALNGQHLGHDPRPAEWRLLALGALEGEIVRPALTELGEWQVERAASNV